MIDDATPGQTVGPFFGYALPFSGGSELVPFAHPDAIRLTGVVLDGAGQPVPDALLEIWQADANGIIPQVPGSLHRDGYSFTGWGRSATDNVGRYSFTTLRPAPTATGRAPFIALTLFARGLLDRLFTRVYLDDDRYRDLWPTDPLLASLPAEERTALIAGRTGSEYRFDLKLQGDDATPFLHYGPRTDATAGPHPSSRPILPWAGQQ